MGATKTPPGEVRGRGAAVGAVVEVGAALISGRSNGGRRRIVGAGVVGVECCEREDLACRAKRIWDSITVK